MKPAAIILAMFVLASMAHSAMIIAYSRTSTTNYTILVGNNTFHFNNITVPVNTSLRLRFSVPSSLQQHGVNITGPQRVWLNSLPSGRTSTIIFTANRTGIYNISCSSLCPGGKSGILAKITAT